MGVQNRGGALYWATGIDNSGLKRDKEQAVGILKGFAKQVTGLDVFAGLGAAAALAFAKMSKEAYAFSKEFQTSMKEVQTISKATQEDYEGMSAAIVKMSTEVPDSAVELSRALYEIVSAGYDGAEGLRILDAASRGAVAGVTTTTVAADGLTTILNAWKLETAEVTKVNDTMFRTVELGKITYDELAGSIAQVAPLAAASGVSFDEIGAAISTLTKQGTPGAQAITQIRSAMVAMNEQLGEGWGNTMSLQEGFQALADISKETNKQLNEVTGRVEGAMAVLATTGKNAQGAAEDIKSIGEAAGAADKAFGIMVETNEAQMKILANNIKLELKEFGDWLVETSGGIAAKLNNSFDNKRMLSSSRAQMEIEEEIERIQGKGTKIWIVKTKGLEYYEAYLENLRNGLKSLRDLADETVNLVESANDAPPPGNEKSYVDPAKYAKDLDAAKKAYDEYSMLLTNGFKKEADTFYWMQLENGKTYKDYLQNQLKEHEHDMEARKLLYLELSEIVLKETEAQKKAEEEAFEPLSRRLAALKKMSESINSGSASNSFVSSNDSDKTTGTKTADAISKQMMGKIGVALSFVTEVQTKSERVSRTWEGIINDITNPEAWSTAGEGIQQIANLMHETNQTAGEMISGIGNISSGIGSMIKGPEGSPMDFFSGSIAAIAGIAQIFEAASESGRTFDEVLKQMNHDLEKQQRILDLSYRKGDTDSAFQKNLDDLNEQKRALEIIVNLGKERVKQAEKAGFIGRLGSGVNLDKLREDLAEYQRQLDDINIQVEDLGQSWTDFTAGLVTELDLAEQIAQAFVDGKTSAADFASYVNDILGDAVLEAFKASILGPELTKIQEYIASALSDGELSGREESRIDAMMNKAVKNADQKWKDYGLDRYFNNKTGKEEDANSLSGSIRASLTEETGSILAGTMNAMRMDLRELVVIQLDSASSLMSIDNNTQRLHSIAQDITALKDGMLNIAR